MTTMRTASDYPALLYLLRQLWSGLPRTASTKNPLTANIM